MTKHPLTFPLFGDEEVERVRAVLDSGWVTQGPATTQFEQRFAKLHDIPTALATTSCTAALHLAAMALELGSGDEVVVPAFTWVTSASCAEYVGARPVFADVDLDTFNLDPAALEAAITPNTRAVVVVHLFGLAADMEPILEIARKHDLKVIEDAACAIGTTYAGRPVGGLGDIGCFSFHPRKVVTTGEGGMLTTRDDAIAARLRYLRNHGATPPNPEATGKPWGMSNFDHLGFNLRLSDIQAAVGLAQLDRFDQLLADRRACGHRYHDLLAPLAPRVVPPTAGDSAGHSFQSYVIRLAEPPPGERNRVMERLQELGVQTRPGTHAVHRLGYYRERYGLRADAFPNACTAEDTSITLPLYPGMTADQQAEVVSALERALSGE